MGRTVLIAALVDILITFSTKAFLLFSGASGNVLLVVLAGFLFVFVGPAIYGVFFNEPLSWVGYFNDGDIFRAVITLGFFKIKRIW